MKHLRSSCLPSWSQFSNQSLLNPNPRRLQLARAAPSPFAGTLGTVGPIPVRSISRAGLAGLAEALERHRGPACDVRGLGSAPAADPDLLRGFPSRRTPGTPANLSRRRCRGEGAPECAAARTARPPSQQRNRTMEVEDDGTWKLVLIK